MPPADKNSTDVILESISDGVFTVDIEWRITSFNRAAETITGVNRKEAIGRRCSEVFRSSMCGVDCPMQKTLKSGRPVIGRAGFIVKADGARIPISVSTGVLKDASGAVTGGVETFRDLSEIEFLRQELAGRSHAGEMVSHSPLMKRIFEVLPAVSASPSTVLIQGETGTGKELLARTIHALSPRREKPFVAVNCGALPDTLIESELFGYKRGAFTGAAKDKPGRFEMARNGTLFIDEIGELSQSLQVKLLRVLQERVYEPLGAVRSEPAEVRVIVATNKDLADQVRAGRFREDLYYRVNVVRIELPPLRRRKEDIPLIVGQFIDRFNRLQHKAVRGIKTEVISLLMAHDWPGNIRELENVIERAFILCDRGPIDIGHLPEEFFGGNARPARLLAQSAHDMIDAQAIRTTLEKHHGNRLAAARELGIHKTTLFRRMKKLGLPLRGPSRRTLSQE